MATIDVLAGQGQITDVSLLAYADRLMPTDTPAGRWLMIADG